MAKVFFGRGGEGGRSVAVLLVAAGMPGVERGGRGGGGQYLARSKAHLGWPLRANASLMRLISASLSSSVEGMRSARRVYGWWRACVKVVGGLRS